MTWKARTLQRVLITACIAVMSFGSAGAQETITFWHGYNELETDVLVGQVIPAFEAQHPGVDVEAVRLGYDELREKIVTSAATGLGPDVVRIDIIWSPEFAAAGILEPLDGYERFQTLLDSVYPGPRSTNFHDGAYYGLPLTTNTQVYTYNAALFAQSGVSAPQTFDEFEDVNRRLTRRERGSVTRYGYDIGGPWAWNLLPWIWSNGGDITDRAITTASGHLDGPASVEALTRIAEWALEGVLAPNIFQESFDGWGSFTNGQVAARQDGPWFPNWIDENHPGLEVGYALMPAGRGGQSVSVVGGENIAIASGSTDKPAAWTFVQFMLSDEAQSTMATVGQIPVVRTAADVRVLQDSAYYPVYLEQVATAKARTPHPQYGEMERLMQDAFWKVVSGEASAQSALAEAARLIDGLIR